MRCNDWSDRCYFTPLVITFGCHWPSHFVCICIHNMSFDAQFRKTLVYKQGFLSYLLHWENVSNCLPGIKLWNNLHSSSFPLPHLVKIVRNFQANLSWQNSLFSLFFCISTLGYLSRHLESLLDVIELIILRAFTCRAPKLGPAPSMCPSLPGWSPCSLHALPDFEK